MTKKTKKEKEFETFDIKEEAIEAAKETAKKEKELNKLIILEQDKVAFTKEEAEEEEARLAAIVDNYFIANPSMPKSAEEVEDEEDITITVNDEGSVVKEEVVKKEKVIEVSELVVGHSFVEEQIMRKMVEKQLKKVEDATAAIYKIEKELLKVSCGSKINNEALESLRKEKSELTTLLFKNPFSLKNLNDTFLITEIERETKQFINSMFSLVNELSEEEK